MDLYQRALRPILFRVPADTAHDLAKTALRRPRLVRLVSHPPPPSDRLRTEFAGLTFATPIGLAPGFDKSGELVGGVRALGFGFMSVGSITVKPRPGNPKPRLLRYVEQESIANCMGMPNQGLDEAVRMLSRPRPPGPPVIASVAGFAVDELLSAAAAIEPHVDAVEIGLVCRNTPETFDMGDVNNFAAIAEGLKRQKRKPTFAKLPAHHTPAEQARNLAMVDICLSGGFDGISINGGRNIVDPKLSVGSGGIAGKATTADALRILGDVAERATGRLAIKAAGGVFDGRSAMRFLEAGATAVELYSAFVYRGWGVAPAISAELLDELDRRGLKRVADVPRAFAGQPAGQPDAADESMAGVAASA